MSVYGWRIMTVGGPRQQTAALERPRQVPAARRISGKAPEAAIIFRIANHHQRGVRTGVRRRHQRIHHRPANAAALHIRFDRHRANHDQGGSHSISLFKRDGPTLQRADEATLIKGGEGQVRQGKGARAQAVGRPAKAVRAKGGIEQRLDRRL